MVYVSEATGSLDRLDTATRDRQTSQVNGGVETVIVNIDDRTRDEHKLDITNLNLDFSLSFSGGNERGGIQLHWNQYQRTEHWNESAWALGVRTVHDYIEDFDASTTTQLAFGLTAVDFEMDLFTINVSGEHRHTEGDLTGETVTGRRNGGTVTDVTFLLHDAYSTFVFQSHAQSGFNLRNYQFRHTPGRTWNGQRTSTNQTYQAYDQESWSDSETTLSSPSPWLNNSSNQHTHTDFMLGSGSPNTGEMLRDDHNWGSATDQYGATTDYDTQTNGTLYQLWENYPLGLTDQHQPIPSMGGYYNAWQTMGAIQPATGYNLQPVATAWGNGISAAGGGASSGSGSFANLNEGWTPATNPNTGENRRVWYVYSETGPNPHDWVIQYYSAPPNEGGELLWTEYGEAPGAFPAWGEGQAGRDTGVTPADEADGSTPPAAGSGLAQGSGSSIGAAEGASHSEQQSGRSLHGADAESLES